MKKIISLLAASTLACGLAACTGDDTSTPTDSGTPDTNTGDTGTDSGSDAGKNPAPPTLGKQIDRMGRPAINTALNKVFETDGGTAGAAKDEYNANADSVNWLSKYPPEFSKNLAIFDGLDLNCGNQIGADKDAGAARYGLLSTALASDRLWVNSTQTTCNTFLAVEVAFLSKQAIPDCGGRTLKYDVIDSEYSALAGTPGVTDGIAADPTKTGGTTFPYLAPAK